MEQLFSVRIDKIMEDIHQALMFLFFLWGRVNENTVEISKEGPQTLNDKSRWKSHHQCAVQCSSIIYNMPSFCSHFTPYLQLPSLTHTPSKSIYQPFLLASTIVYLSVGYKCMRCKSQEGIKKYIRLGQFYPSIKLFWGHPFISEGIRC